MDTRPQDQPFDWGKHSEAFWRECAAKAKPPVKSEMALRFFVCEQNGHPQTESARLCGAAGDPRTSGYRLKRSANVKRLQESYFALTGEIAAGPMTAEERRSRLEEWARGGNPQASMAAIKELNAMEAEARLAASESTDFLPELMAIAEREPALAIWLAYRDHIKLDLKPLLLSRARADLAAILQFVSAAEPTGADVPPAEPKQEWNEDRTPWKAPANGEDHGN